MSASARNRLNTEQRRAQLLELGITLFGNQPYSEISIDDIASKAGISKGLLYHYFGGKRTFYVACIQHAADTMLQETNQIEAEGTPLDRIRKGLNAYFDFVEKHRDAYSTLMLGGDGTDADVGDIIQSSRDTIVTRIMTGLGLSEPRPVYRLAARSWIGAVEGAVLDWLRYGTPQRHQVIAHLLVLLLTSLRMARQLDPTEDVKMGDPTMERQFLALLGFSDS